MMAKTINFIWNYCNETAIEYLDKHYKWISKFELANSTAGCSKILRINSQTIQIVAHEYIRRRHQFKRRKLAWRSEHRSLGWIPFRGLSVRIKDDTILYNKCVFRFWKSREILGRLTDGSFNQDSKGNWYLNLNCEITNIQRCNTNEVGIDLGLNTIATLSNGIKMRRPSITGQYAERLAIAQRANKRRQVTSINNKIKNTRKDWNHKQTTNLINQYGRIYIGNINSSALKKTKMAKSVSDASWSDFKSMLAYKAIALGVEYKEVKEMFSTVTCSVCFERSGPSGLSALGVREWTCKCGAVHDRDVNAAKNILRFGHESPIKGKYQAMVV